MLELQELDPAVSIRDQLNDGSNEPAVLINVFHVAPEKADALIAAWPMTPATSRSSRDSFRRSCIAASPEAEPT